MFQGLKRLVLGIVAASAASAALSAADITGKVVDENSEPLIQATVRLLSPRDSSFVKGTVTDLNGAYRLSGVNKGKYIVEASYVGYSPAMTNITVSNSNISLNALRLSESSVMLKDVTVVGVKTQVKVMEDTVEFNADSYKTQPNAVVEDLLKRLPGVEVGSDGKITANGKDVSKILVDGKEFFSDDPTVASKNLPVDMIEKLQVVDRKSDLARMTGVDDGEDETVINLTVKKDMKRGWFGTVEGGYGTDDRYLGQFNISRFTGDNQFTILGAANNINQLGFNDGNSGRFRRFGGDNGITTSQSLGLNFNVGNKEIFRVGGDVMWSRTDRDTRQTTERQYLFSDSSSYASMGKYSRDRGQNLRADFRLKWQPDSFNTLDFRPRMSWNHNHSYSIDSTLARAGDALRSPVSRSFNTDDSRGDSWEFGARLIYNHNFRSRRGRSFSVMANYSHSNVREDDDSYSRNIFYLYNDSVDVYDQRSDNHTWSNNLRTRLSWTEPLGDPSRGNFLTFAYGMNMRWNDADKLVYDRVFADALADAGTDYAGYRAARLDYAMMHGTAAQAYEAAQAYDDEVFNADLSNRFRNKFLSQDLRVGYKHVSKTHNIDLGLSLVPSMSKSENLINDAKSIPTRWVWNFAPFLRYRYRMGKQRSINLHYNGRSSQPSMTQLQPVPDMSDPMKIVIGNPELKPTFTHSLRVRFQDFNQERQRSIMLMADVQMAQNSIISRTSFDNTTSAQTTTYTNVNGVWSGRLMNMFSMPLGRSKLWQFSNHVFVMGNRGVGFNDNERNVSTSFRFNESPGISFRPDNLQIELRPRYSLQLTHNSLSSSRDMTVHSFGGMLDAYYYTPIGIILNSDLSFSATRGYSAGYDRDEWMWNASISYQFLRGKQATVTLKAYDLLQQRSNISRNETPNYIDDQSYNSLTRYFMVTLSYKFNTFGKGNEPKSNSIFREGPPGGPMGPPPGGHPRH